MSYYVSRKNILCFVICILFLPQDTLKCKCYKADEGDGEPSLEGIIDIDNNVDEGLFAGPCLMCGNKFSTDEDL